MYISETEEVDWTIGPGPYVKLSSDVRSVAGHMRAWNAMNWMLQDNTHLNSDEKERLRGLFCKLIDYKREEALNAADTRQLVKLVNKAEAGHFIQRVEDTDGCCSFGMSWVIRPWHRDARSLAKWSSESVLDRLKENGLTRLVIGSTKDNPKVGFFAKFDETVPVKSHWSTMTFCEGKVPLRAPSELSGMPFVRELSELEDVEQIYPKSE